MSPRRRNALGAGFAALGTWRLAAILTVWTVLPALFAASSLSASFDEAFAGTLAGDHILRNHPSFAPTDVFDFLHEYRAALAGARRATLFASIAAILLQIFFAGGLVEVLGKGRRPGALDFIAGARRNFWHNAKCFVLFLVPASIAIGVWIGATGAAGRKLFERTAPGEASTLLYRLAVVLIAFAVYAAFSLWHDFARAARRVDPRIGTWRGYGLARRVLAARWPSALALFLFWLVLGAIAVGGLFVLTWSLSAFSPIAILLLFVLQLATLAVRSLVRIGAWGSYLALLDSEQLARAPLRLDPAPDPPEPEPAPFGPFWDETTLV